MSLQKKFMSKLKLLIKNAQHDDAFLVKIDYFFEKFITEFK